MYIVNILILCVPYVYILNKFYRANNNYFNKIKTNTYIVMNIMMNTYFISFVRVTLIPHFFYLSNNRIAQCR